MTPNEFRAVGEQLYLAHHGTECPTDVQLFRFLASQLESDPRTVSRWIYGESTISGPARAAIKCFLERRSG